MHQYTKCWLIWNLKCGQHRRLAAESNVDFSRYTERDGVAAPRQQMLQARSFAPFGGKHLPRLASHWLSAPMSVKSHPRGRYNRQIRPCPSDLSCNVSMVDDMRCSGQICGIFQHNFNFHAARPDQLSLGIHPKRFEQSAVESRRGLRLAGVTGPE